MIRRAATYALIAAFSFATTPSFACTGISLNAKDGSMIRGRTMEFGFPLSSNVIVIPAGTAMNGTLPDGKKGISYTTRYAVAGANAVGQTVILDGLNGCSTSRACRISGRDRRQHRPRHGAVRIRRLGARQFCYRR
jgi:choloylglycine hydrolase